MNTRSTLFFIVLNWVSASAVGQKADLKGLVSDSKQAGIPNASLALRISKDSSVVQEIQANEHGFFHFAAISDGTYFVSASSSGYLLKNGIRFTVSNGGVPFDTLRIMLAPSVDTLTAAVVSSKKPLIENKPGRTLVNVDAFLNNAGSSLLEVLGNSPNVDVDFSGSINVKGRQGVLVFIDGKQNYLTGTALINLLNSIPASQVEQIEIMTQPPARYDAAGNSGVINIKLKKNKQVGFNGNLSVSYMQGFYPRTLNSAALNYKKGSWNFFGNASYNYVKRYTRRALSRALGGNSGDSGSMGSPGLEYDQDENDISIAPDLSVLAGADRSYGQNGSIGLVVTHRRSGQENDVSDASVFKDQGNGGKPASYLNDDNVIHSPWVNTGVGLHVKKDLTGKRDWSADLNFEDYRFNARQQSSNYSLDSAGNLIAGPLNPYIQKALLPSSINIYSAKTDYSCPLGKMVLETGAKSSFIQSTNNSSFYFLENNSFQEDPNLTNFYNYKENINAAYVDLQHQSKKWSWEAGLRLEETNASGRQNVLNQQFRKSYIQLFPTLTISYDPNEDQDFNVIYGRRIDRPNYSDLNPFLYLLDQYTYRKGNPDLQPFFSHSVEVAYNYKGNFHVDIDYGRTTGIIDYLPSLNDSTKILLQSPANLNALTTLAFNLNYALEIRKWSTLVFSYSLYNNHYSGLTAGNPINNDITTHLINYTQQFRLPKGWSAELNVVYRSAILLGALATRGPRKISGFAVGKDILKGNGNLKCRVTDPLYIQQSYGSTDFGNVHTTTHFREDSRRIGLTFTYRLQNGVKSNTHKLYSPEENNRITPRQ